MPGENLDVSSEPVSGSKVAHGGRPFLGITFACCRVYSRVYVNQTATAYQGNCPRCGRAVRVGIGPSGSDARFFTAY